jgi:Cu-Zn family superoxide dismutase
MKTMTALMFGAAAAAVAMTPAQGANAEPGQIIGAGGKAMGTISVAEAPKGVVLRIDATGLTPGWHAVHFHEKADCSDAKFQKSGGHVHNEKPLVHGLLNPNANDSGDLTNIHAAADGTAKAELYTTLVSLTGTGGRPALKDADGSALVIHAKPDDHKSQPIGGAGDRIGCAIIP